MADKRGRDDKAYIAIEVGSPCVVPSLAAISQPPVTNSLAGF